MVFGSDASAARQLEIFVIPSAANHGAIDVHCLPFLCNIPETVIVSVLRYAPWLPITISEEISFVLCFVYVFTYTFICFYFHF